jgi:hypothetical protein
MLSLNSNTDVKLIHCILLGLYSKFNGSDTDKREQGSKFHLTSINSLKNCLQ